MQSFWEGFEKSAISMGMLGRARMSRTFSALSNEAKSIIRGRRKHHPESDKVIKDLQASKEPAALRSAINGSRDESKMDMLTRTLKGRNNLSLGDLKNVTRGVGKRTDKYYKQIG